MGRGTPDAVEGVLQLAEDADRADQQRRQADDGADDALARPVDVLQQGLHRGRALLAHQAAQLVHDLATGGDFAEGQAGHRDGDEEQRRDREQGVVGQGRTHARRIVVAPGGDGLAGQGPEGGELHDIGAMAAAGSGTGPAL